MSKTNENRLEFYKTFFTRDQLNKGYAEVPVNGWWLIRHYDGNKDEMVIDLYSNESYQNYVCARQKFQERQQRLDFIQSI